MYPHLRLCLHLTLCAHFTPWRAFLNFDLSVCVILVLSLCVPATFPSNFLSLFLGLVEFNFLHVSVCVCMCMDVCMCVSCVFPGHGQGWFPSSPSLSWTFLLLVHFFICPLECLVSSQPGSVCLSYLSPSPSLIPDLSLCTCSLYILTAICKDTPISSCTLEPPHLFLSGSIDQSQSVLTGPLHSASN